MAAWEDDFTEYFVSRGAKLRRMAYMLCGDWHEAEDLVQATFIRLYRRWRSLRDETLDAYAYRVLVNVFLNGRKRSQREQVAAHMPESATQDATSGIRVDLVRALAELPPQQRAAVVLRHLTDMSVAEVADMMGVAEGTVKSQTARGVRQEGLSPAANPVDTPTVIESAVQAWAGADYAGFVLDDIYPSDWTRTTALPNGQEANATDWHGRWTLPSGEFLVVSLMYYAPNAAGPECNPPNCSIRTTTEGTTTLTDVYFMGSGSVASVARDERGDGFAVLVWLEAPTQSFSYTPEKLLDLATDPSLTFPYPAVVPNG
jgi:RNA polymerase sigma-70 factor (sigma-E family)